MRMHPRRGISPHVGQELDALATQQPDELLERTGRVADGPDNGGSHPRWTLALAIGSATGALLRRRAPALVTFPADFGAGFTHQEIEVDASIRLRHGFAIELDPAALGMRRDADRSERCPERRVIPRCDGRSGAAL